MIDRAQLLSRINSPQRVAVLGAVRSGLAATRLLRRLGVEVFVSDRATGKKAETIAASLDQIGVEYELGEHSNKIFDGTDLIISSPGIDQRSALFEMAKALSIPIWTELELAWRLHPGKTIAITGTNGKSTVTTWIGECFRCAKVPHVVAGNIGTAFSEYVLDLTEAHWAVLEVSSFQLAWIDRFAPEVAVILNLTPDHLDRYNSVEEYYQSKFAIVQNQQSHQALIRNEDDDLVREVFTKANSRIFGFSINHPLERGVWMGQDSIYHRDSEETATPVVNVNQIKLLGRHNLANACAVIAAAACAELPEDSIVEAITTFKGLEHRLQMIPSTDGLQWVNDSKATTPDSARVALLSFPNPVIWLAGGYDKGMDFSPLCKLASKRVKCVIAFGAAGEKVANTFADFAPVHRVGGMRDAMVLAKELATRGDAVLLSPMCASFDEFNDYEDRGRKFVAYVEELQDE